MSMILPISLLLPIGKKNYVAKTTINRMSTAKKKFLIYEVVPFH